MRQSTLIDTPVGRLKAIENNGALAYLGRTQEPLDAVAQTETPLFVMLRTQLGEYFERKRQAFDIPLHIDGTLWQKTCWDGLVNIPFGETRTYGWLAAFAGNPKGARAAGGACHANPILILIPCHRIVGANGSLTGFGAGLDAKDHLLRLENPSF